jgi:hypothetical protein
MLKNLELYSNQDENTKLELITGIAAKLEGGNDIDTQLQPHAAGKLSWTSIMCRIGLVICEDCTGHRPSTLKRDEHQVQAAREVTVSVTPGHWGGRNYLFVFLLLLDESFNMILLQSLAGFPHPLASAFAS